MERLRIEATDGDIGRVRDVLFDDEQWTVRWLVVDTGGWLPGRQVLLPPSVCERVDWGASRVRVDLTRDRVANSPPVSADRPVSRQVERDQLGYYGWPYYWSLGPVLGGPAAPFVAEAMRRGGEQEQRPRAAHEQAHTNEPHGDVHLRSAREVTGYAVRARDGEIGRVDDFVLDDERWAVRYVVVDTRPWWFGGHVLMPPRLVREVSWDGRRIEVDVGRERIRAAPEWKPRTPITPAYEQRLTEHYRLEEEVP